MFDNCCWTSKLNSTNSRSTQSVPQPDRHRFASQQGPQVVSRDDEHLCQPVVDHGHVVLERQLRHERHKDADTAGPPEAVGQGKASRRYLDGGDGIQDGREGAQDQRQMSHLQPRPGDEVFLPSSVLPSSPSWPLELQPHNSQSWALEIFFIFYSRGIHLWN